MKIAFLPQSKSGKWSVAFFCLLVFLVVWFFVLVNIFNQRGGETFFSNLMLTIPMLTAWVAGLIAFVLSVIALFKAKIKSVVVFIVSILSFLTTLYGVLVVL